MGLCLADGAAGKNSDSIRCWTSVLAMKPKTAGGFFVRRSLDQGASVRHAAGPVTGVDQRDLGTCRRPLQGSLFQCNAHKVGPFCHGVQHLSGGLQLSAVQADGKCLEHFIRSSAHSLQQCHKACEGGPGDAGVTKGDPTLPGRGEEVFPTGQLTRRDQLCVVDQHHRKGGKRESTARRWSAWCSPAAPSPGRSRGQSSPHMQPDCPRRRQTSHRPAAHHFSSTRRVKSSLVPPETTSTQIPVRSSNSLIMGQ